MREGAFSALDAALPSAVSVVALLAFGLVSGAKGLNPRRQVKLPALLLRMIACSTPRSRTPGMRARSSGHSQGTASRVLSPTGGTVTTTPAPSRSSSTRHCSWLRCSSCHGFLLTRSGLGTALIRFRVRCFEEGWMLAKEEVL